MTTQGPAPGLSIFFPAYNDSGTIASLVITALRTARKLTPDHEVIVLPGTRHFVFVDDPDGFVTAIKRFLGTRAHVAAG